MRELVSTALVALIVSVLTVTAVGVLAQDEPATTGERTITPAGINAATVDGKSAVGFTKDRLRRKNKLVATNRYGFLPPNIVKPKWGLISGKPAGFADGVDNAGVTGVKLTLKHGSQVSVDANLEEFQTVDCPAGSFATGGGAVTTSNFMSITTSYPSDADTWKVWVTNTDTINAHQMSAYVVCLSTQPGEALTIAQKGSALPAGLKNRK